MCPKMNKEQAKLRKRERERQLLESQKAVNAEDFDIKINECCRVMVGIDAITIIIFIASDAFFSVSVYY